eukprot:7948553-Pyramimonas_sp.AAC.1
MGAVGPGAASGRLAAVGLARAASGWAVGLAGLSAHRLALGALGLFLAVLAVVGLAALAVAPLVVGL